MPHDPIRIADVRSWIHKAARDLLAGDHERAADPPILEDVVFHAQQAVEKVLKGFLAWHDHPFRKTHDLIEIGQACVLTVFLSVRISRPDFIGSVEQTQQPQSRA